jgi:hypothetical protein
MKYEQWAVEPFIRDFDTRINKEVNPDILDTEITRIIHNYLSFRNIQQSETQKAEMIAIILHEIINFPFLKSYTIRWALNEFTDLTNQNVSAAVLIGMIKKGYSHEKHKEVLKLWELADQKNRLPELTEAQKEDLNAKARADSWAVCVDQVANSSVDFENPNWRNAAYYLAKELAYKPNKAITEDFNTLAIQTIKNELKAVTNDLTASREERGKAIANFADLCNLNFEDKDLKGKVDSLRRKMIVRNYIELNFI